MSSSGPAIPTAAARDDIRSPPVHDKRLLDTINDHLTGIPDKSITAAIVQVPSGHDGRVLRGAVYINVGRGLSFATWLDHDLDYKPGFGWGVAIRKTFGGKKEGD